MDCNPAPPVCPLRYSWVVKKDGSASDYASGETLPASFDALCDHQSHTYDVTLSAWCGNTRCLDCPVRLNVTCNYTQWWAQYYNYYNYTQGANPPDDLFASLKPVFSGSEACGTGAYQLDHNWSINYPKQPRITGLPEGVDPDYFMARWTGDFRFDAGTYTFSAKVDDGVEVLVNNNPVIGPTEWRGNSVVEKENPYIRTGTIEFTTAGWHTVEVRYFQRKAYAVCQVNWTKTG